MNMTAEDLQTKYDGNLNSEMVGPLHNLIAKVRHIVWREHQMVFISSRPELSQTHVFLRFDFMLCGPFAHLVVVGTRSC